MGRRRSSIARSRVPWPRRLLLDPAALRYWLAVLALSASVAAVVAHNVRAARSANSRWGTTVPVLVTTRRVDLGDSLRGSVERARWPVVLAPPDVLARIGPGARAASSLDAGVPITARSIARASPVGPAGRRVLAIPVADAQLPVHRGDVVDVWASVDPTLGRDGARSTRRVAVDARVVSGDGRAVVVAVRPNEVAAVAEAAGIATISLVGRS